MTDKNKSSYHVYISSQAKDNWKKLKYIMEHETMNDTIDWLFTNPGEGAEKLKALAVVLDTFKK